MEENQYEQNSQIHDERNYLDEYECKEAVKKHWLSMALLFILPILLSIALSNVLYTLAGLLLPVDGMSENALYFTNYSLGMIIQALAPAAIPAIIMYYIYKRELAVKYTHKYDTRFIHYVLFYAAMTSVSSFVSMFSDVVFETLHNLFGIEPPTDVIASSVPTSDPEIIIFLISIIIIGPVAEEILFRGVILKAFRGLGDTFAAVMSGVFFGLYHGNFYQAPYTIMMGIMLGVLTIRAGSILPATVIHIINNFVATTASYSESMAEGGSKIGIALQSMTGTINSVWGIIYLLGYLCAIFLLTSKQFTMNYKKISAKIIFKNPQFYVFVASCIIIFTL